MGKKNDGEGFWWDQKPKGQEEEEGIDLAIAASLWKRPMKDNKVPTGSRPMYI